MTLLKKDEEAYLRMLKSKRDSISRQINKLSYEKQIIVQEIIKVESGQQEFQQTNIKWEEV